MIRLYRSNRLEQLCSSLGDAIREPPAGRSPLDPETIVVQSRGMQDWLTMELSRREGICANVNYPFPHTLIEEVYNAIEGGGEEDKWLEQGQLLWRLLERLDNDLEQPGFEDLRSYLEHDASGVKRYQLAKNIALLFDKYSHFRPKMVIEWDKAPLEHWQASLWHSTISANGISHPATMALRIEEAIESKTIDLDKLPRRVSLFGIPSLSPLYLHIFGMLSDHIDVNLFLLSPCREYWADIVDIVRRKKIAREQEESGDGFSTADLHIDIGNPLLSSLGRIGREFQFLLEEGGQYEEADLDLFSESGEEAVLAALQSDILNLRNRGRGENASPVLLAGADDGSVSIHSCHNPMREVEVLRDQLLDLFEKDESLEPRDVVVMLPSLGTYAPYIEAVFGARGRRRDSLPYAISDVRAADEAPVVEAFLGVIALASARATVEEVLGLLESEAVRDRFGLSSRNIEAIENWVVESGIRWGIDAGHRSELGQPAFDNNSWRFGLDRMLLGIALPSGEAAPWEGRLPCEMIEGTGSLLLGNLAWYCETLFGLCRDLRRTHTAEGWRTTLLGIIEKLCSKEGDYSQQHQVVRRAIERICGNAVAAGFGGEVGLDVIRSLFSDELGRLKTSPGRMGSGITFCAMVPMRSIPFRVVCLMGMNDSDYPKPGRTPGFDLTRDHPRAGDRSLREEDRYCFLEALLSARDKLLITYCGQSIRDNKKLPPSVVVSELLDALSEGFDRTGNDGALDEKKRREQWIISHPLQPFSPRYFDPEHPELFSYSGGYYEGARALHLEPAGQDPFFDSPLEERVNQDDILRLDDLLNFFQSPGAAFLRDRLNIYLGRREDELDDREPIELNPLELYKVGNTMLSQLMEERTLEEITGFFSASGLIPPGTPGDCLVRELACELKPIAKMIRTVRDEEELDTLQVDLPIGRYRLQGKLAGIYPRALLRCGYQRFKENRLLRLWIEHLVLCRIAPRDYPRASMLICRKSRGVGMELHQFREVAEADSLLDELLELYEIGQREPLLLFPRSSSAYLRRLNKAKAEDDSDETALKALQTARREWEEKSGNMAPESEESVFNLLFREANPLLAEYPEEFGLLGKENRFDTLVQKIFFPLQEHLGEDE
ncbi:MAG: exodeoxyribonuclease V subunit gamma [Planctomycetota bacterium]|nr:exodeoxyribonuclease V subunit gamma [Planctomycetota bacterium]